MTDRPPEPEYEAGDYVIDLIQDSDPEETADPLVVLAVHDDRADEFGIETLNLTVAEAAVGWPIDLDGLDGYVPDADRVAEAVFVEALEKEWGTSWTRWTTAELREQVADARGVRAYSYHAMRLEPHEYNTLD